MRPNYRSRSINTQNSNFLQFSFLDGLFIQFLIGTVTTVQRSTKITEIKTKKADIYYTTENGRTFWENFFSKLKKLSLTGTNLSFF